MDTTKETIGGRLRIARGRAGFKLKALADLTGISFQRINKYERNKCRPSYVDMQMLSVVLHHSPAWIAFNIGPERLDESETVSAVKRATNAIHLSEMAYRIAFECEKDFDEIERVFTKADSPAERLRRSCLQIQMILRDQQAVLAQLCHDLELAHQALIGKSEVIGVKNEDA
jgi:transcriptional regulator with XRE-family HTH domain